MVKVEQINSTITSLFLGLFLPVIPPPFSDSIFLVGTRFIASESIPPASNKWRSSGKQKWGN